MAKRNYIFVPSVLTVFIFIGCLFLVDVKVPVAGLSQMTNFFSVLGAITTVIAFFWAYKTYVDWDKTQKNSEYEAVVELGKAASSLVGSTVYLFETMQVNKDDFERMSPKEHGLRNGKIAHSVAIFEKNIERYNDYRSLTEFLGGAVGSESYMQLDKLVSELVDWFWLFRYEQVESCAVKGESSGLYTTVYFGVKIPEKQKEYLSHLGIDGAIYPSQFEKAYSNEIVRIVRSLLKGL